MYEDIVHVAFIWPPVRLCTKSSKGALMQVDSQRRNAIQKHVNPQVIF